MSTKAAPRPGPTNAPMKKPVLATPKPQVKKPVLPQPKPSASSVAKKPVRPAVKPQTPKAPSTGSKVPATKPPPAVKKAPVASKAPAVKPQAAPKPAEGPKAGNWINRTVQGRVASVGNYAGGFINSIGDSVNKIGEGVGMSISNTTRYWGQGVASYGNDIKDAVGVGGPRVATSGNPLGLAGVGSSKPSPPASKGSAQGGRSTGGGSASNPLGI